MYKKIIAFLFSFSIVVSLFSASASAADIYGGGAGRLTDFWSLSYKMWLDGQSDWNPGGIFSAGGGGRGDFASRYADYVSTLDSTTASSSVAVTGFSATKAVSTNTSRSINYRIPYGIKDYAKPLLCSTLKSLGVWDKALITGCNSTYLYGYCFKQDGSLAYGVFENPLKVANASLFGVYDISDLHFLYASQSDSISDRLYYSMSYAEAAAGSAFVTSELYALTFTAVSISEISSGSACYCDFCCYYKPSTDTVWSKNASGQYLTKYRSLTWSSFNPYITSNTTLYIPDSSTISLNNSQIVVQPSGTDSSTRTASLMQTINDYNIDNSYTDNPTAVNSYLKSDNDETLYSPVVFDESAKVFTVPETGQQFLCDTWYYHFASDNIPWVDEIGFEGNYIGSYILDIADNSFVIGDTVVPAVWLVYTDEKFYVIPYYIENNTFVPLDLDVYSYALVSQSACNIDGHSYTYETVKEPTCTAPGERKYTCSVCGDEYAEDIPTVGHSYEYSIYQAPTCTAAGIGLYTCSTCGDQYTEPIAATGHTDKLIEYVPTVYDDNGVVITLGYSVYECSVCGAQYTVNDEVSVKEESWFSWLGGLFKKAISAIVNGFASGIEYLLEHVIGAVSDFIVRVTSWAFNLFDGSALVSWFDWFSEDNAVINNEFAGSGAVSEVDVWAYSFG